MVFRDLRKHLFKLILDEKRLNPSITAQVVWKIDMRGSPIDDLEIRRKTKTGKVREVKVKADGTFVDLE